MKTKIILLVYIVSFTFVQLAHSQCSCQDQSARSMKCNSNGGSYLPDAIGIPAPSFAGFSNGVSKQQVQELLDVYQAGFPDITFVNEWEDPTVNAVAYGNNNKDPAGNDLPNGPNYGRRHVVLFGGMARHPYMALEGLSIILAHEVGHHYGNTERVIENPTSDSPQYDHGAFCEGQSDFWATRVGMRLVYNNATPKVYSDKGLVNLDWSEFDNHVDSDEYKRRISLGIQQCHAMLSGGLFVNYDSFILGSRNPAGHDHKEKPDNAFATCGHPIASCRKSLYESGAAKVQRSICSSFDLSTFSFFGQTFKPTTEASYQKVRREGRRTAFGGQIDGLSSDEFNALRSEVSELKELIRKLLEQR